LILATKQNKTKEKETKSSKLEATVYYIYTCQFPNRLQEQEQQFANRLQEQEKEQEKEQEFEQCWRVLAAGATVSTLFYSVSTYMNNTYFSNSIGALSVTRYT